MPQDTTTTGDIDSCPQVLPCKMAKPLKVMIASQAEET